MVKKLSIVLVTLMALGLWHGAPAQSVKGPKHFAARGLSFDYPAAIELDDRSSPGVQHLVIQSQGRAQIMIMSRLDEVTNASELAEARHEVVDPFVETVFKQIHEDDPNVARSAAQILVGGAQATGVRLRAFLNHEPGNAEIYSLQLGPRLVVLSLIGTDKEIAESAPVWLAIRRSLKVGASTEPANGSLSQDHRKKAAA
jgi:hypothetical protein